MKKILESAAIVSWIVLVYLVVTALYGPDKLPERIPTHFGLDGQPNGWGSPQTLLTLPIAGTFIGLLMSVIMRYPGSFSFPVRVRRENQARLQELALGMIAWLRLEVLCLFVWIEWGTIESARQARLGLPPALLLSSFVIIFGTIIVHVVGMVKAR
jgi:uncharacterized membrane protein